jgi:anaerobic selenocysteine-containing dehydrogenase
MKSQPPADSHTITGIAAADIRRLARAYARTQPAAIRMGVAVERHHGGGQALRAISPLPALVGAGATSLAGAVGTPVD